MYVVRTNYRKENQTFFQLFLASLMALIAFSSPSLTYLAVGGSERSFTQILVSPSMRANSKYTKYMEWYGKIVSFGFTIVCVLGLGQLMLLFIFTIVYYSNTAYWDGVDSLKQQGQGGAGFGGGMNGGMGGHGNDMGGMGGVTQSVGVDTIVDAFNRNMLNVKRYSDCSVDNRANLNISEDSTMMEWLMRRGPVLVIAMLVMNMGWKGTLQLIAASTIDAMTVFFESLPYEKMVSYAEYKAAQETGYTFTLGMSGSDEGLVKERLAKDVFSKVQSIARITEREMIQTMGSKCEGLVVDIESKFVTPPHLASGSNSAGSTAPDDIKAAMWKSLKFDVRLATTQATQDVNQGVYTKVLEITPRGEMSPLSDTEYQKYYVIIAFRYTDRPDEGIFTAKYIPTSTGGNKTDGIINIQSPQSYNSNN